MAARAIWSGALSFGLVNIPVKLTSAAQSEEIDFDLLSKEDLEPVRYARIDPRSGEEVEWKDIVKGFQYAKGKYVVVTDEDFEKARPEKTKSIDLIQFVKQEEIDPIFYEKPYYLLPDKGAEKSYHLLLQSLQETGTVALAEFMLRNRMHLCAVKALDDVLLLNQMRYGDAIREAPSVPKSRGERISARERELAIKLITQLTGSFDPSAYKDTYIQQLRKVIKAKAAGKNIRIAEPRKIEDNVRDLMEELKKSLEGKRKRA